MALNKSLSQAIVSAALEAGDQHQVIQPVELGSDRQNELVMFIKPEVFMDTTEDKMSNAVEMMLDQLDKYEVDTNGVVVMPGPVLEQQEIMNRHYGYINQMSRMASEMITDADRQQIAEQLGVDLSQYTIYGGHEFLQAYPDMSGQQLDELWFKDASTKIRSGFYVRADVHQGDQIVLVNAFHPEQLAHFTMPDRKIVLLVVRSDAPWDVLRTQMIGETFPEKALPDSIRGTLYNSPQPFGFESVSIANNAVHLSAGPTEAMFELHNFLSGTVGLNFEQQPPNLMQRLLQAGLSYDQAIKVLENPTITVNEVEDDLHSHFEHVDTDEAVQHIFKHFNK